MYDELPSVRKKPIHLQLAPMIDIFTMIIVFLMKGAVLGGVSIVIPQDLSPAVSLSKESVEAAPEVVAGLEEIWIPRLDLRFPTAQLKTNNESLKQQISEKGKAYLAQLSNKGQELGVHVNLVADAKLPYGKVFELVKALKEAGFQSVLFIARGDKKNGS